MGVEFVSEFRRLPPPLDNRFGVFLAGSNRSDNLFMYIYRPVSGLVPGQRYKVRVDFTIATKVPPGCPGAGGSPGESVYVRAGATIAQPTKTVLPGTVASSIKHGGQSNSGTEMIVVGNMAGGGGTCLNGIFAAKSLSTAARENIVAPPPPDDALLVTADAQGRLWIVLGTDSAFEGRSEIYYLDGAATFTPA